MLTPAASVLRNRDKIRKWVTGHLARYTCFSSQGPVFEESVFLKLLETTSWVLTLPQAGFILSETRNNLKRHYYYSCPLNYFGKVFKAIAYE